MRAWVKIELTKALVKLAVYHKKIHNSMNTHNLTSQNPQVLGTYAGYIKNCLKREPLGEGSYMTQIPCS